MFQAQHLGNLPHNSITNLTISEALLRIYGSELSWFLQERQWTTVKSTGALFIFVSLLIFDWSVISRTLWMYWHKLWINLSFRMMNLFSPNLPPFSGKVAFFYSWLDLIWNSNSVEVKLLLLLLSYLYEFETQEFRFNLFFLSETNIFPTMNRWIQRRMRNSSPKHVWKTIHSRYQWKCRTKSGYTIQ